MSQHTAQGDSQAWQMPQAPSSLATSTSDPQSLPAVWPTSTPGGSLFNCTIQFQRAAKVSVWGRRNPDGHNGLGLTKELLQPWALLSSSVKTPVVILPLHIAFCPKVILSMIIDSSLYGGQWLVHHLLGASVCVCACINPDTSWGLCHYHNTKSVGP